MHRNDTKYRHICDMVGEMEMDRLMELEGFECDDEEQETTMHIILQNLRLVLPVIIAMATGGIFLQKVCLIL